MPDWDDRYKRMWEELYDELNEQGHDPTGVIWRLMNEIEQKYGGGQDEPDGHNDK